MSEVKDLVAGAKDDIAEIREKAGHFRSVKKSGAVYSHFGEVETPYGAEELKAYRGKHGSPVWNVDALLAADEPYKPSFKTFGDFLKGVALDPDTAGGQQFRTRYASGVDSIKRAVGMNTFEGENGGLLVFPEFSTSIMERKWQNDLYGKTTGFTVSGNSMTFPKLKDTNRGDGQRAGGVISSWTGEAKEIDLSKPSLEDVTLKLNKLTVAIRVTQELLDDSGIALEQFISSIVASELNYMLGKAVIRGTGVKQPTGVMNGSNKIAVPGVGGQPVGVIGQNILDMEERVIAGQDDSGYEYFINNEVQKDLCLLELGSAEAAQLVYLPPGGLKDSPHGQLMGRNVNKIEFCSGRGVEGDIILSDLSQMYSIAKGGIVESMSPHVKFLSDEMVYKFTFRVDCKPIDDEPITPEFGTTQQSANITIANR